MLSRTLSPKTSMALIFEEGQAYLSSAEAKILKAWITAWSALRGPKRITIGGANQTSRAGRLRRVNALLQVFKQLGVMLQSIQIDSDWAKPVRMGSMDDLPADVVWLQLQPPLQLKIPA